MSEQPLHLFEGFGIELEYMIVRQDTLDILPVSDQVLYAVAGDYLDEVPQGELSWSNEIVLHVLEFKCNGPAQFLSPLPAYFQRDIQRTNQILASMNGVLMPTAMHPWMKPTEARLWPHNYNEVYEAYNHIFNCQGHGWSNLQSMHINLPFGNEEEFGKLHAATRLVLPIIPGLAASSPILEKQCTGLLDTRMEFYRHNQKKVPSLSGSIIPEPVFTYQDYDEKILHKLYQDIAPYDPEGILQEEWLNSRGAIARFERNAIEIRVIDIQETPLADIAIAAAITALLQALIQEKWASLQAQQQMPTDPLANIFLASLKTAEQTIITNKSYLALFGIEDSSMNIQQIWKYLIQETLAPNPNNSLWLDPLNLILEQGPLARRILQALPNQPSQSNIHAVYSRLCDCLENGKLFVA